MAFRQRQYRNDIGDWIKQHRNQRLSAFYPIGYAIGINNFAIIPKLKRRVDQGINFGVGNKYSRPYRCDWIIRVIQISEGVVPSVWIQNNTLSRKRTDCLRRGDQQQT